MKVNIKRQILNIATGKTIDNDGDPLTLKDVMMNALMIGPEGEKQTGEDKYKLYELAEKVSKTKTELELTTDEISNIKKRIGAIYGVNVVGQAYNMLEGKA